MTHLTTEEAIRRRRAVKSFDPAHKMTAEEEEKLFDLAFQSPSSFNIQHWRIVKVESAEQRAKLKEAAWGQAQVSDASLLLVVCADTRAWEKDPARYWTTAPEEARARTAQAIIDFYKGRAWLARDEALRSVGLIAQTIMLAAKDMGYDSCPMIGCDIDAVGKLVNLPEGYVLGMMLAIGKGIAPPRDKGGYLPRSEVLVTDSF